MNINDLQGGSPKPIHSGSTKINSPHTKIDASETKDASSTRATQHSKDPEVVDLVNRLADSPEIRPERIAEVKQKLDSGDFFGRQSAEATAEAFLR